jgi:hypothetical protein
LDKFISITKARQDVKMLNEYIALWESYETDTVEKQIIKEYALLSSLEEVANRLNSKGYSIDDRSIEAAADVRSGINQKPKDDLHRIVRSGYLKKARKKREGNFVDILFGCLFIMVKNVIGVKFANHLSREDIQKFN